MTAPAWDGIPENWGKGHYRDVPVSKWVKKARERHIRDLKKSQEDPNYPYYFDQEEADRVVWFIENNIVQWEGDFAGQLLELSAWQEWDIIRPLFGWLKKRNGKRRFRKALMLIARKNGKSTLIAAIALYLLVADCEAGAQVYCAATKEEQAKIVFKNCIKFIKRSPKLRRLLQPLAKVINFDLIDAVLKPLGKDSDTQDGFNVHGGIIDEYHAHKDASMLGVLTTGIIARSQPLICIISTAGFDLKSPLKAEQELMEKILDEVAGYVDEEYFGYLCTIDYPKNWEDPEEWHKANPQLGLSINFENFQGQFNSMRLSSTSRAEFKVKHLNLWQSSKDPWLSLELWKKKNAVIDWLALKEHKSYLALDLGKSKDLTALAHVIKVPHPDTIGKSKLYARVFHFCAADTIDERSNEDRVPYRAWADANLIHTTPGRITRNEYLEQKIHDICREYYVVEVAGDPWNALDMLKRLENDGVKAFEHGQRMTHMAFPCRTFEELITDELIEHDDNPVLDWQIEHATVVYDGNGNIKLMKDNPKNRIDGVVALVMAVGRAMSDQEPELDLEVFAI